MTGVPALLTELKQCGKRGDLKTGISLHTKAVEVGCERNKYVSAALISMYGKCRSMTEAWNVFCTMAPWRRDVVLWNSLIMGYVDNGQSLLAMELFISMDCAPDSFTFVSALKALSSVAATGNLKMQFCLQKGMEIHKLVMQRTEHYKDIFVRSNLIDMYCKCHSLVHAQAVFNNMASHDVVAWNILMFGYIENGENIAAMDLYVNISCQLNCATFVAASKAVMLCVKTMDSRFCLEKGIALHKDAKRYGHETDPFVAGTLVDMYSKCRSMAYARTVFDAMDHKPVVVWNILIAGYVENGESLAAMETFSRMDCEPNSVTFVVVLKACSSLAHAGEHLDWEFCLEKGMEVHKRVTELGFHGDALVVNTLVDMYRKCKSMSHASAVFNEMVQPDIVAWNSLIHGFVENGECLIALDLFRRMTCEPDSFTCVGALKACLGMTTKNEMPQLFGLEKGVEIHRLAKELGLDTDRYVGNTLVDIYCKLGNISHARAAFNKLIHRDVFSWTSLILGYVEADESLVALELFFNMDCEPNWITFVAVIKACGRIAALECGRRIHSLVRKLGLEQNPMVATSLVDFYGKCGEMAAAVEVFRRMSWHDAVSWNALIAGYSSVGETFQVFDLLKEMQEAGLQPNGETFLSILTACSHLGLVEDGEKYFESMAKYGVEPGIKHYTCMVDMFQRANRVEEALSLVKSMSVRRDACVNDILQKLINSL